MSCHPLVLKIRESMMVLCVFEKPLYYISHQGHGSQTPEPGHYRTVLPYNGLVPWEDVASSVFSICRPCSRPTQGHQLLACCSTHLQMNLAQNLLFWILVSSKPKWHVLYLNAEFGSWAKRWCHLTVAGANWNCVCAVHVYVRVRELHSKRWLPGAKIIIIILK